MKALRWIIGVFILIMSIGTFISGAIVAGCIILFGAIIIIPNTGSWLELYFTRISKHHSAIGYGMTCFFIGLFLVGIEQNKSASRTTTVATETESVHNKERQKPVAVEYAAPSLPSKTENSLSTKFSTDGMMLIEGDGWDEMRNDWGKTWIKRINETMPLAMQKAASSPECDFAETAGISDRSTVRKEMIFFVDCRNGKRFFISQNDLNSNQVVVSKNAKIATIDDVTAIEACEKSVKSQLNFPLSFNRHWTATAVHRAPSGNIAVEFIFDSKNALGAELPQKARCIIDDEGIQPAEISAQ